MNPYEIRATLSNLLGGQQIRRDTKTYTKQGDTHYKTTGELATELGRIVYSNIGITSELAQAVEGIRVIGKYKQDHPQIAEVATDKEYTSKLAQAVARGTKWKARPSVETSPERLEAITREVNKIIRKLRKELTENPDPKKSAKYIKKLSKYLETESEQYQAKCEANAVEQAGAESQEERILRNKQRRNNDDSDKAERLPPQIRLRVFNELRKLAKMRESQRRENTTKGKLQPRRLGKYPTPYLFSRKEKPAPDITVYVLIDLSGSMCRSPIEKSSSKLDAVVRIKNELQEWNKTQKKVRFDIRGFNAQYYYAEQIGNNEAHAERLADSVQLGDPEGLESEGENPMGWNSDGYFLRRTLKEMQECTTKKALLILSDGQPAPYEYNSDHHIELKDVAKELDKSGVPYMSIGIFTEAVKEYYKHHQVIRNLDELPRAIARTVTHFMK